MNAWSNGCLCARTLFLGATCALSLAGCDDKKAEKDLAPQTAPLEAPEAPTEMARTFSVDTGASNTEFLMEAPLENIHGVAPKAMSGELFVDLMDVTKTTGLVKVDLLKLELFQTKRENEKEKFGEEEKNATQNEHMRTWFQISDDAPAEMREKNRFVEFKIVKVSGVSDANVGKLSGAQRNITATVAGELRLHGRTTKKTAKVDISFVFDGDTPKSMKVATQEPVPVGLAEHDVQPRSAFDKLAQKTLGALGQKVAEAAPITFEFTATPKPAGTPTKQAEETKKPENPAY